jgi:hypothetical protein
MTNYQRKNSQPKKQKNNQKNNHTETYEYDKSRMGRDLYKCENSSEYVKFARKYGASVRLGNHYVIRHANGRTSTLSCTHGKQTALHKTKKEFKEIYGVD